MARKKNRSKENKEEEKDSKIKDKPTKKGSDNSSKNNKKSSNLKKTSDIVLSLGTRSPIDPIDAELIQILLKNGRLSNVEIANMLNTSEATIRRRIHTLKDRGFIRGFTTLLDYKRFGHVIMAHVFIQAKQKYLEELANTLTEMENSCSVYRVIGEYNLSSVMVFKNIAELQEFLDKFSDSDSIDRLNYLLATSSYKSCPLTGI